MRTFIYILLWFIPISLHSQSSASLLLNGCDNCISVSNSQNLLQNIQELTIDTWIFPNCEEGNLIIFGKQWCLGQFSFSLSANNGKLFWVASHDGFCNFPNILQSKDQVILPDMFTHVVLVYTRTQTKMYINGNEIVTEWAQGGQNIINNSNEPFRIGCYKNLSGGSSNFFSGLINNLRVWSKALSPSEINFSKNNSLSGTENNLILNYEMTQHNGTFGPNILIENKVAIHNSLRGRAYASNSYLPKIITTDDYLSFNINIGNDTFVCDLPSLDLEILIEPVKEVIWNNTWKEKRFKVLNPGNNHVMVETEMCRYFYDSIYVGLNNSTSSQIYYNICPNDSVKVNETTYTIPGFYTKIVTNNKGCDSLIAINITLQSPKTTHLFFNMCEAGSFEINNQTYNQPGTYTQTLQTVNGCDSILQIQILPCLRECNQNDTLSCYRNEPFPKVDFAIAKVWESSATTAIYQSPLLADMDNDCIPEIVMSALNGFSTNPRITSGINIVNTSTGESNTTIQTPFYFWGGPTPFAVADIDYDGFPEIVIAAADVTQNPSNVRGRLVCYDAFGNRLWVSDKMYGEFTGTGSSGGAPAFADFNQDGIPEVYIYNEIFNAQTGIKLAGGGFAGCGISFRSLNIFSHSTTIAANLDDNPDDLELAAGYTIYKVNIGNTNGSEGNTMTAFNLVVDNLLRDGYTSIADINLDGKPDVIVSSQGDNNTSRLYVYHLNHSLPELIAKTNMPGGFSGCCPNASGVAFAGDIDGSGSPVIGVCRPYLLITYRYDGTPTLRENWRLATNDESGSTGMTMFDFNQDGIQEIVYRDENFLRIINGAVKPPVDLASFSCNSGTGAEYPIVGDIDFSGSSKICVPCGQGFSRNTGKIHVFAAPRNRQTWAPSRGIWNQYNYHVLNISDELTVPRVQANIATFSNGRFNNFLVQASLLDSAGNFLQTATDLDGKVHCVYYDSVSQTYLVRFDVSNKITASASVTSPVNISFFNGNPFLSGNLVGTYTINLPIPPGKSIQNLEYSFSSAMTDTLYMLINVINSVNQPDFLSGECDYENNIVSFSDVQKIKTYQQNICNGDSLYFNNQWFYQTGLYNFVVPSQNNCDSIYRLVLTVNNPSFDVLPIQLCEGDSVMINQSWIYNDTLLEYKYLSHLGCDSIVNYDITFLKPDTLLSNFTLCRGDSLFIKNQWYYMDVTVEDTLDTQPCPLYTRTEARWFPTYSYEEKYILCPGDSIVLHNQTFQQTGIYSIKFQSSAGCDSTYQLHIQQIPYPDQPVFEPDCNLLTYSGRVEVQPGWNIRWSNDSKNYQTEWQDSTAGFVEYTHDSVDCRVIYPFFLEKIPDFAPELQIKDTIVYPGKPILIIIDLNNNVWDLRWMPNRNMTCSTCFNNTITTREDMDVLLQLTHVSGCEYLYPFFIGVDESLDIIIPNIFSPDGTAPNDTWTWFIPDCFFVQELKVYDRWGNLVFHITNPVEINWNGMFNGKPAEQGVFTYITTYLRPDGSIVTRTGDVTIIR